MVQPPSKKFAADQENVSDSIEATSAWQEAMREGSSATLEFLFANG
jgi:hypothetical protein